MNALKSDLLMPWSCKSEAILGMSHRYLEEAPCSAWMKLFYFGYSQHLVRIILGPLE